MPDDLLVRLTDAPLDPAVAMAFVQDPRVGGIVMFAGTVRDGSADDPVTALEYEAWEESAISKMRAIGGEIMEKWPIRRVAILHRTGSLAVGEISVLVCCSSAHRAEAFEAARHGIERIKQDVPIWKKENFAMGESRWVMGS